MKNVGRARNWSLWAGDRFTEVTVKAGLTVIFQPIGNTVTHEIELFVDVGESERVHIHATLMIAKHI